MSRRMYWKSTNVVQDRLICAGSGLCKELQTICYEFDDELYAIFIDLKQAYNSIVRTLQYRAMTELNLPKKSIRLAGGILEDTMNKVGEFRESFRTGQH